MIHVLIAIMISAAQPMPPVPPGCLTPPVTTSIATRFVAPECPYCAGRRTVDFGVAVGVDVVAPISGTVTFAGVVAGSQYVTIRPESDGAVGSMTHLVTIGGVAADPTVIAGSSVVVGRRLGTSATTSIRLSVRRVVPGGVAEYLDPEPSIVRWRAPVRLIPDPTIDSGVVKRRVPLTWSCRRALWTANPRPAGQLSGWAGSR